MVVLRTSEQIVIRTGIFLAVLFLLALFAGLDYELTVFFWHTTYWFVALFLSFILLSNLLAQLANTYLNT